MRKSNIYACKISISENIFSSSLSDLKKHFKKAIKDSEKYIRKYNSVWGFMDVKDIVMDGKILKAGVLLRGKDQTKKVVDTESKKITDGVIRNVAFESNFLFDLQSEIVVFEEKTNVISRFQFIELFKEIILDNEPDLGKLLSEFLPAPSILKEIDKFNKIKFAKFEIHPANWDYSDNFDELDEKLKELKVKEAIQIYKSEDGLEKQSSLFKDPLNMILAGYGDFLMNGEGEDGEKMVLKSDEELLSDMIELESDILEEFIEKSYIFLLKSIAQHRRNS